MRAWSTGVGIGVGLRFQPSKELTKTVFRDQTGRSWWHIAMEQLVIVLGELRREIQLRLTRMPWFIESLLGVPREGGGGGIRLSCLSGAFVPFSWFLATAKNDRLLSKPRTRTSISCRTVFCDAPCTLFIFYMQVSSRFISTD